MIAHAIVSQYGERGLAADTVTLEFSGTAGQSFGAFAVQGMTLILDGQANDYVGKGLSGGCIVLKTPADFHGASNENIIAGNTTLYGATEGQAYINGVVESVSPFVCPEQVLWLKELVIMAANT